MNSPITLEKASPTSMQKTGSAIEILRLVARQAGYLRELTFEPGTDPETNLEAIADDNQIPLFRCDLPEKWWQHQLGPFIGTTLGDGQEQLVTVLPYESGGYVALSEANEVRQIRNSREAELICSQAWFVAPVIDESADADSNKDETSNRQHRLATSIRSLTKLAWLHWTNSLVRIVICLATSILLSFATPIVLSQIIDRALPMADQSFTVGCIALLIAFNLSQSLLVFLRGVLAANALASAALPLQAAVTWRLLQSPIAFFRGQSPGELAHRNFLISNVCWQYGSVLFESQFTGIITVSSCFVAAWLSPQLFAIALPVSLIEAILYYVLVRKIRKHATELESTRSQTLGQVVRWLKSITLVKSCGIESTAARDLGRTLQTTIVDQSRLQQLEDIRKLIGTLIPALGFILVLNAAYYQLLGKGAALSIGSLAGFIAAYRAFSMGLSGLATGLAEFVSAGSQLALMRPILEQSIESFSGCTHLQQFKGRIEFSNVTFLYPDSLNGIRDVSIVIEPGEFVGVLGMSGSGKSTLLRLILGLDTPQSGIVRVDGCISTSLNWHRIRQQIGSVQQSTRLFHGTIRENILNGRHYAESQIRKILDMVELSDTVDGLPLQLETIVSQSGANLSGGQCQRILLARALVSSPSMLVLDEAMSGLDEGQQNRILKHLKSLGITIVYVSHRQSCFQDADRLISIEQGLVVETHRDRILR